MNIATRRRFWLIALVITAAAVLSAPPSHAATPSTLKCYSTTFEPYVIEKDGVISGIDVDIIKMAGAALGIEIEVALMPWARLELQLKAGLVDCVAAYFRTPEREEYMLYTGVPLHVTSYSMFVSAAGPEASLSVQTGWRVGLNKGFKTTTEFDRAVAENQMSIVELKSTKQSFDMLALKRIDAVLTDYHVGRYLVQQHYPGAFTPIAPNYRATPAYFVFAKREPFFSLISKFDNVLMQMMVDGRYKAVFDSYAK